MKILVKQSSGQKKTSGAKTKHVAVSVFVTAGIAAYAAYKAGRAGALVGSLGGPEGAVLGATAGTDWRGRLQFGPKAINSGVDVTCEKKTFGQSINESDATIRWLPIGQTGTKGTDRRSEIVMGKCGAKSITNESAEVKYEERLNSCFGLVLSIVMFATLVFVLFWRTLLRVNVDLVSMVKVTAPASAFWHCRNVHCWWVLDKLVN
ncbi:MAG: hypothetical protein IPN69_25130 [Acidobacteria bacterium]|nr:hypothetical protein [Acidobacteriota bacterium]